MKPQVELETDGDTDEPLSNGAERPSVVDEALTIEDFDVVWESVTDVAKMTDAELLAEAGIEPVVSTTEAAEYFDRTSQWIYWGLKPDPDTGEIRFKWPDGTPIIPDRIGQGSNAKRRFTTPILRAILASSYQRGNVTDEELKRIIRRIRYTELGVEWRELEGWRNVDIGRNRRRWVKPEDAYYDDEAQDWKLKKGNK